MTGDEDFATQSLRRRPLSKALLAVRNELVVDLSGLSFADSSLMLDLAMLARRARKAGGHLVLRDAQPDIRRLIEMVGLHRFPAVLVTAPSA